MDNENELELIKILTNKEQLISTQEKLIDKKEEMIKHLEKQIEKKEQHIERLENMILNHNNDRIKMIENQFGKIFENRD